MKPWNAESDLKGARKRFGHLSKEVVAHLREHGRARVAAGELHLFECPMAAKFDFKLWVQDEAAMANPYMGQMMLECGFPAEL